jgi:hypothetical protein
MMGLSSPFWLIVWAWNASGGVGVTAIPMPSEEACHAAQEAMPGYFSTTPTRGICIPGEVIK